MKTFIKTLVLLFSILVGNNLLTAQTKLSVQGVIRLSDGNAVEDGDYAVEFKLYDVETGGTELWSEVQPAVKVTSGIYSTILGEVTPLDIPFDEFYFLSISIEGEELQPRAPLTSAPYANSMLGFDNVFPSTGDVGIGTDDPQYALDVKGNNILLDVDGAGTPRVLVDNDSGRAEFGLDGSGNVIVGTGQNKEMHFVTNNGVRMRMAANGNVGLGLSVGSERLAVAGKIRSSGDMQCDGQMIVGGNANIGGNATIGGNISNGRLQIKESNDNRVIEYIDNCMSTNGDFMFVDFWSCSNDFDFLHFERAASVNFRVRQDGEVFHRGLTSLSDARLKENKVRVTDALSSIKRLDGYSYNMIADEQKSREYGLMAQEVQEVFPEMVSIFDDERGYLGVAYTQLIPVLIEGIKELEAKVSKLEMENANLKSQNTTASASIQKQLEVLQAQVQSLMADQTSVISAE